MTEVKQDIFSKINDGLESKLGAFGSSFVKLAVTGVVGWLAVSAFGVGGVLAAAAVTAIGRKYAGEKIEKYKGMKALTPFERLLKDTALSLGRVLTAGKAFVKKYDKNDSNQSNAFMSVDVSETSLASKNLRSFGQSASPEAAANNNAAPTVERKNVPGMKI